LIREVYRLRSSRYPANNGRGAAINGGRWNVRGTEAIYTAQSRALAALEILVHYAVLPQDFVLTSIRIPDAENSVLELQRHLLSHDWNIPGPAIVNGLTETQDLGLKFLSQTFALGVPSAIIPDERIYVLNPAHRDFGRIEFMASEPFRFDPRLKEEA
jgi:RES domain-containing protein